MRKAKPLADLPVRVIVSGWWVQVVPTEHGERGNGNGVQLVVVSFM